MGSDHRRCLSAELKNTLLRRLCEAPEQDRDISAPNLRAGKQQQCLRSL